MVGRTKGPRPDLRPQPFAGHRVDSGNFKGLLIGQWRQNTWQAAGEHGFAGSGWAVKE